MAPLSPYRAPAVVESRIEMAAVLFTAYTYTVGWSSGVSLARLSVKTRRTMAQPLGTY